MKTKQDTLYFQVRAPRAWWREVRILAVRQGESVNQMILRLLREELEREGE